MDTFKVGMERVKKEREAERASTVDMCGLFIWTGFSVLIVTPLMVITASFLHMSRPEALVSGLLTGMMAPVIIFMVNFMVNVPLAERCVRRD